MSDPVSALIAPLLSELTFRANVHLNALRSSSTLRKKHTDLLVEQFEQTVAILASIRTTIIDKQQGWPVPAAIADRFTSRLQGVQRRFPELDAEMVNVHGRTYHKKAGVLVKASSDGEMEGRDGGGGGGRMRRSGSMFSRLAGGISMRREGNKDVVAREAVEKIQAFNRNLKTVEQELEATLFGRLVEGGEDDLVGDAVLRTARNRPVVRVEYQQEALLGLVGKDGWDSDGPSEPGSEISAPRTDGAGGHIRRSSSLVRGPSTTLRDRYTASETRVTAANGQKSKPLATQSLKSPWASGTMDPPRPPSVRPGWVPPALHYEGSPSTAGYFSPQAIKAKPPSVAKSAPETTKATPLAGKATSTNNKPPSLTAEPSMTNPQTATPTPIARTTAPQRRKTITSLYDQRFDPGERDSDASTTSPYKISDAEAVANITEGKHVATAAAVMSKIYARGAIPRPAGRVPKRRVVKPTTTIRPAPAVDSSASSAPEDSSSASPPSSSTTSPSSSPAQSPVQSKNARSPSQKRAYSLRDFDLSTPKRTSTRGSTSAAQRPHTSSGVVGEDIPSVPPVPPVPPVPRPLQHLQIDTAIKTKPTTTSKAKTNSTSSSSSSSSQDSILPTPTTTPAPQLPPIQSYDTEKEVVLVHTPPSLLPRPPSYIYPTNPYTPNSYPQPTNTPLPTTPLQQTPSLTRTSTTTTRRNRLSRALSILINDTDPAEPPTPPPLPPFPLPPLLPPTSIPPPQPPTETYLTHETTTTLNNYFPTPPLPPLPPADPPPQDLLDEQRLLYEQFLALQQQQQLYNSKIQRHLQRQQQRRKLSGSQVGSSTTTPPPPPPPGAAATIPSSSSTHASPRHKHRSYDPPHYLPPQHYNYNNYSANPSPSPPLSRPQSAPPKPSAPSPPHSDFPEVVPRHMLRLRAGGGYEMAGGLQVGAGGGGRRTGSAGSGGVRSARGSGVGRRRSSAGMRLGMVSAPVYDLEGLKRMARGRDGWDD